MVAAQNEVPRVQLQACLTCEIWANWVRGVTIVDRSNKARIAAGLLFTLLSSHVSRVQEFLRLESMYGNSFERGVTVTFK